MRHHPPTTLPVHDLPANDLPLARAERGLRVAVVWNHPSRLLDCSFRFEQYLAGFRALGHEPFLVATRAAAEGFEAPMHVSDEAGDFERAEFWRQVGAEVAVIVTWHRMSGVLGALRAAGTRVVAIADSDGRVGTVVDPAFAFERSLVYCRGMRERAVCLRRLVGRYLRERLGGSPEDAEALASTGASDVVALGHREGLRLFGRFLAHYGAAELGERLVEVPFTIGAAFLSCPVPAAKEERIAAIGRWDDPQKNAPLLAAALARFAAARPHTAVEIFGAGGEDVFAPLVAQAPQISYHGVARQEVVAETLSRCRSIVFASRWEGCPHAATEALALGATLVGTPIPSLRSWCEGDLYGTLARRARPAALAAALAEEMAVWDAGGRDAAAIAGHWRPRLAPASVCRALLAPLRR